MTYNKTNKKSNSFIPYLQYVFLSTIKRPYSYISGIIYLLFLATVLLFVPLAINEPVLTTWSSALFNTPVFNIVLIALTCSCLAIAVFKKNRQDGTDLNVSAKPISRLATTLAKLIVYLVFMFVITGLAIGVASLTICFGEYSIQNPNGISLPQYRSLLLGIFLGSLVNILIFGGISILIANKGPTVATIVGTTLLAFIMAAANLLFTRLTPSTQQTVENQYGLEMKSYSLYTANDYFEGNDLDAAKSYATIINPENQMKFDTYEYWTKAQDKNGFKYISYIDLGKQLSLPFEVFEISQSQLDAASRNWIGMTNAYKYTIHKDTSLLLEENIESKNYPIGCYQISQQEGRLVPTITFIGHYLSNKWSENWYGLSHALGLDFYSINFASVKDDQFLPSPYLLNEFNKKICYRLSELKLDDSQVDVSKKLYEKAISEFSSTHNFNSSVMNTIISDESEAFFKKGQWDKLSIIKKYEIVSKLQLNWYYLSQQTQINEIQEYNSTYKFPFSSEQVNDWFEHEALNPGQAFYNNQLFIDKLINVGINIEKIGAGTDVNCLLSTETLNCESFKNMYRYTASQHLSVPIVVSVYSIFGLILYLGACIAYHKQDIIK